MIIGIGNDLIEMGRVERACGKDSFLKHCFTERERDLISRDGKKAAGNFAVKESVAKALGTGFAGIAPQEIECLRDDAGKPYVNLYGRAEELAREKGIRAIHVSISNTKEYAAAFAVGEG